MPIFILGTYTLLTAISIFLFFHGLSLMECLFLYIYPTAIFLAYYYLMWRRSRDPAFQAREICQKILDMTRSNDCFPSFNDEMFDKLEEMYGDQPLCDMSGYITGPEGGEAVPMWYDLVGILLMPVIVCIGDYFAEWWFSKPVKDSARPVKCSGSESKDLAPYRACIDIIEMTTTNDGLPFRASFFDDIERGLAMLGETLHCDIGGYAEGSF